MSQNWSSSNELIDVAWTNDDAIYGELVDLNNSGHHQAVLTFPNGVHIFNINGGPFFRNKSLFSSFNNSQDLSAYTSDIDNNGYIDVVYGKRYRRNIGQGIFLESEVLLQYNCIGLQDINNDGYIDALHQIDNDILVSYADDTYNFGEPEVVNRNIYGDLSFHDLNNDGHLEMIEYSGDTLRFHQFIDNEYSLLPISIDSVEHFGISNNINNQITKIATLKDDIISVIYFDTEFNIIDSQIINSEHCIFGHIQIGDINNDSIDDIVTSKGCSNGSSHIPIYFKGESNNTYSNIPIKITNTTLRLEEFEILDLESDGDNDIISTRGSNFFLNQENEFRAEYGYSYISHIDYIADLDSDKDLDIIAGNTMIENKRRGRFFKVSKATNTPRGSSYNTDLNMDGFQDSIFHLFNQLTLKDGLTKQITIIDTSVNHTSSITFFDIDSDGKIDILTNSKNMSWYRNTGNNTYERNDVTDLSSVPSHSFLHDLDGDGDIELAIITGEKLRYHNFVNGVFESDFIQLDQEIVIGSALNDFFLDVDGDGLDDYIYSTSGTNTARIAWKKNLADGYFGDHNTITSSSSAGNFITYNMDIKDIDSDGDLDIVYGRSYSIYYLEGKPQGEFETPVRLIELNNLNIYPFWFDIENDGIYEILYNTPGRLHYLGNSTQQGFSIGWGIGCDDNNTETNIDDTLTITPTFHSDFDNDSLEVILMYKNYFYQTVNPYNEEITIKIPESYEANDPIFSILTNSNNYTNSDTWLISSGENCGNIISGTIEDSNHLNWFVYPNPTDSRSNISITSTKSEAIDISVVDILGKKVRISINETLITNQEKILDLNLQDLNSGLYLIIITGENGVLSTKTLQKL